MIDSRWASARASGSTNTWWATVRPDDVREQFAAGPDPQPYLAAAREYTEAGYDHLVLMNAGPDPDGFLDFFAKELRDRLLEGGQHHG